MAVIFINYDEPNPETYESVGISMNDKGKNGREEVEFKSGNFVKDWYDCIKYIIHNVVGDEPVLHSSSVDHFIMDGANFDTLWLAQIKKDVWDLLKYDELSSDSVDRAIEFFIEKGTNPTWEELKEICKN